MNAIEKANQRSAVTETVRSPAKGALKLDPTRMFALVLLVVGVLVRLLLMTWVHPYSTVPMIEESYMRAAQDILRLNLHDLGDRVPVYPLFVALCGLNPRAIWCAQSILGILSSLMIFDMALRRTRNGLYAFVIGLACSLIPEILLYEFSVLTEVLTNFLLVTIFWLISRRDTSERSDVRYLLGVGTVATLAGLTRPLMICLVPVFFGFLVPFLPLPQTLRRENIQKNLAFVLPVFVGILGWCAFNYFNTGYFTPTTRSGQQLLDQVDPYVYLAPQRFAVLRDAWLRSRQENNPFGGLTSEEVYEGVVLQMQRQTGETPEQVSHELTSLAVYLEIHHPILCLRRAELGWMQFWGQPSSDEFTWPPDGAMRLTAFVMAMANFLLRELKGTFLILALLSIPCAFFYPKAFTKLEYLTFTIAVWVSVFAAFTEYGDNRRFCVPLYMPILYTTLTVLWGWITATPGSTPVRTLD
jgi:hypothetical protein